MREYGIILCACVFVYIITLSCMKCTENDKNEDWGVNEEDEEGWKRKENTSQNNTHTYIDSTRHSMLFAWMQWKKHTQFCERKVVNFPYLMCILQSLLFFAHSPIFIAICSSIRCCCRQHHHRHHQHLFVWKCNTILIFVNKIHIWCRLFSAFMNENYSCMCIAYVCSVHVKGACFLHLILHCFFSLKKRVLKMLQKNGRKTSQTIFHANCAIVQCACPVLNKTRTNTNLAVCFVDQTWT